ncbi:phosphotransferase family protein [Chelatococcus reniformis]|uniref:Aminoglycoside phosphotransferase n=1 Tax=Chelatococcus reniformis TaxID=1494448 RepID=A0A916U607_9HYPH|nr:phosphotransferase family protein [Chelatococcus reniformis]GGC58924.1 putative aminoglycoside phosphotransferase [Chelatococcus reniformis]
MDANEIAALVDERALVAWLDAEGLGEGPLTEMRRIAGGTQNLLLFFRRGGRSYVLRRPPRHSVMNGNDISRREARVLAALAETDVPHPRLIAACASDDVLGCAFYVMEPVDGINAAGTLPEPHACDAAMRHRMGLELAGGIATLGEVDLFAVGLGDFGKLDGFLERQVGRWRRQLESYSSYEGWPGYGDIPGVDDVGRWLEEHRPSTFDPGIIHGDYHLSNVMFRPDGPELAAIVDWELATIGDPLTDLGWLLATWPEPSGPTPGTVGTEPWDGFPTARELVAHYAARSRRDTSGVAWHAVLGCYKLGILQEGTHARAFAGKAGMDVGLRLHNATIGLFERALGFIDGGLRL